MTNLKYCPHCGKELPEQKEQPKEQKKKGGLGPDIFPGMDFIGTKQR